MYNEIGISAGKLKEIKKKEIIAFACSSEAAMGNPGNITIVTKDIEGVTYFTGNTIWNKPSLEDIREYVPQLRSIIDLEDFSKVDGWQYIYGGMGNHLFIDESMYINIRKKHSDTSDEELYSDFRFFLDETFRDDFQKEINGILKKPELAEGLNKYMWIQKHLYGCDVSQDEEFQRRYNGFYRMRQRNAEFYKVYYEFMEENKDLKPSFAEAVHYLNHRLRRLEASFASKLVATLDTDKPVWDSVILKNIGLKQPCSSGSNREQKIVDVYNELEKWYQRYMLSEEGKQITDSFNKQFPDIDISDVKKIDLVLWQKRD